jgi:hypothetical protein
MTSVEKTSFRKTKIWKEFRENMIASRCFTCEICGTIHKKGLNLHHKDERNYDDLQPDKFAVVCKSDHRLIERLLSRTKNPVDMESYCKKLKEVVK